MGFVDNLVYWFKRILRRSARRAAEEVVDEAVDYATEKAVDYATDKALEKSGVTVTNSNGTSTETSSLREVTEEAEANGGNVTININVNGPTAETVAAAHAANAAALEQMNQVMSWLILDKNNNVIGVKDDAPDYIKNAYANGEFND